MYKSFSTQYHTTLHVFESLYVYSELFEKEKRGNISWCLRTDRSIPDHDEVYVLVKW